VGRLEEESGRDVACYSFFNLYGEYLMKEALAEVGNFKIVEGYYINKGSFAITAKTQEELQNMVNRLVETGSLARKSTNHINVGIQEK
jgi:hypothetical protein